LGCLWDNVEKWAGQATDENVIWCMHIACWILRASYTLGIGNTYCFSTATLVARMHLIVMLHIQCLSCWTSHVVQVSMCIMPLLWRPVTCTLESLDSAWVQHGEHWSKCVTLCNGIFLFEFFPQHHIEQLVTSSLETVDLVLLSQEHWRQKTNAPSLICLASTSHVCLPPFSSVAFLNSVFALHGAAEWHCQHSD
jgi:hypothetical protein